MEFHPNQLCKTFMQKILHAKAFSVATVKKLQFIQIDFNTLMAGGNKWSDMYYLNEPGVLGIYDLLLQPGIKGLTGLHKQL